jgi:hypothetical protein
MLLISVPERYMNVSKKHFAHQVDCNLEIVTRVHWIRARGQKHRWTEEFILTGYEMEWTVRFFLHEASKWRIRGNEATHRNLLGAAAYACKKVAMWQEMSRRAEVQFMSINNNHRALT